MDLLDELQIGEPEHRSWLADDIIRQANELVYYRNRNADLVAFLNALNCFTENQLHAIMLAFATHHVHDLYAMSILTRETIRPMGLVLGVRVMLLRGVVMLRIWNQLTG